MTFQLEYDQENKNENDVRKKWLLGRSNRSNNGRQKNLQQIISSSFVRKSYLVDTDWFRFYPNRITSQLINIIIVEVCSLVTYRHRGVTILTRNLKRR